MFRPKSNRPSPRRGWCTSARSRRTGRCGGCTAPVYVRHEVVHNKYVVDGFRDRVNARLLLLPPHDPQFRRNRERVNRDAERERIAIDWDLGYDEGS